MEIKKMITTPMIVEVVQVESDTMDEIAAWCNGTHEQYMMDDFIILRNGDAAYPGDYIAKYSSYEAYAFTEKLLQKRFMELPTFVGWADEYVKPMIEESTDVGTD